MEIFKPINNCEGYEISNLGNVLSKNYNRTGEPKLLKPNKQKTGYYTITIKNKLYLIHRLVAEAFIPNPNNLPYVNHKDEDKSNNSADNLEWCTKSYNNNYGTHNERVAKANTNGKLSKQVFQYTKEGELVRTWLSLSEIKRQLDYSLSPISNCCLNHRKSAYGYIWKY